MDIDKQKIIQAGKIASQVKVYARTIVKKETLMLEIAEKIEAKIFELGGKPAFPVNLSIDNIAAHYTPSHDDKKKLIKASEEALENALNLVKSKTEIGLDEIGKTIQETIEASGFYPVAN